MFSLIALTAVIHCSKLGQMLVPLEPKVGPVCLAAVIWALELVWAPVLDTATFFVYFSRVLTGSYTNCPKIKRFKFLLQAMV